MAKRRGNHEGSICQRPNGRWQAQISIDGDRISKSFTTRGECVRWLRDLSTRKEYGLSASGAKIKLSHYLQQWLDAVKPNLRHKTWDQYRRIVIKQVLPTLGERKLLELRPIDIQNLYTARRKAGLSPRSLQLIHSILHNALGRAVKWGLLGLNPAAAVSRPRVPKREMAVLNATQVCQLLLAAKDHRLSALFRLAVTGGLRLGELLGLKWSDVDWASSTIHVMRQLQRHPDGGIELNQPKTARSIRTVQLGKETLRELMRQHNRRETMVGVDPHSDDLIFVSRKGRPLRSRGVQKAFKGLLEQAGLPEIRFHDLRHTAASLMLSIGMPVYQVARQLGHAQASTTLDVYGHLIPGLHSDAAEKLDQMLTPIAAELQQDADHQAEIQAQVGEKDRN